MRTIDTITYGEIITLVFACLAILALAIHEWRTRQPRARMLPDSELPNDVARAVRDCTTEYIGVRILGYSHSEARSHLRAYIRAKHDFLPDVKSAIQREALIRAREHEQMFPIQFN